jgi:hypothetical protein
MGKRGATKQLWKPDPNWFWSFVDKNGPLVPRMKTNCWLWLGWGPKLHGYGLVKPTTKQERKQFAVLTAHRVAWELEIAPIPEGRLVLHHCDNRACVRPSHLFLGDDQANVNDMMQKKRDNKSHGEHQHLAKLTDEAVRFIRQERSKIPPTPLKALAQQFGTSLVAISFAALGRTWKHVI